MTNEGFGPAPLWVLKWWPLLVYGNLSGLGLLLLCLIINGGMTR